MWQANNSGQCFLKKPLLSVTKYVLHSEVIIEIRRTLRNIVSRFHQVLLEGYKKEATDCLVTKLFQLMDILWRHWWSISYVCITFTIHLSSWKVFIRHCTIMCLKVSGEISESGVITSAWCDNTNIAISSTHKEDILPALSSFPID